MRTSVHNIELHVRSIGTVLGALLLIAWCVDIFLPSTTLSRYLSIILSSPFQFIHPSRMVVYFSIETIFFIFNALVTELAFLLLLGLIILWGGGLKVLTTAGRTARLLMGAILLFCLLIMVDFFISPRNPYPYINQSVNIVFLSIVLAFSLRANSAWWRFLIGTMLVCIILQCTTALVLYAVGRGVFVTPGLGSRLAGTMHTPSRLYGVFMMGTLLLIPFALSESRRWLQSLCIVAAALLSTALLLTFSRAGGIGLAAGTIWHAFTQRQDKRATIVAALAVATMVAMMVARANPVSGGGLALDRSALGRVQIWRVSARVIRHNWLIGTGFMGYHAAQARYLDERLRQYNPGNQTPQNLLLTLVACHGVLGVGIFALSIRATWAGCRVEQEEGCAPWERNAKEGIRLAGIGILAAGLADAPVYGYDRYPGTFMWLVCMGFLLHLELRNHPPSGEWKHALAFRRASLVAGTVTALAAMSVVALGVTDAHRASGMSQAKIDAVRAEPTYVSLRYIPYAMADCVIANEDNHFYDHHGYSLVDMHRALRVNIRAGRVKQGGSTITQQLAKNLFFTNARTLRRKVAELIVATDLERRLKKDEILELYLNTIEFGLGTHGIGPAAKRYFGKDARNLTDGECALLAGLISSPPKERLTPERARAALALTLSRLAYGNPDVYSSVRDEIDTFGETRWLARHLVGQTVLR